MTVAPRRRRVIKMLAFSQALSWLGDSLIPVVLSVAVIKSGGSVAGLGAILATGMVCRLVFMLVGGVWADRFGPRRMMMSSDVARAALQMLLAMEVASGELSILRVAVLVGLTNVGSALFTPAFNALRAVAVPAQERQQANGRFTILRNGAVLVGPILAGVLVVHPGPAAGFVLNGLTFVVSAVLLRRMWTDGADHAASGSRFGDNLRDGWAEVVTTRWYLHNLGAHGLWNLASGAMAVVGPILAMEHLGGPHAVAAVAATTALGGLAGGLLATRVHPSRPLVVGNLAMAFSAVGVVAYIWPSTLLWVCIAAFTGRAGVQFLNVCWETTVQNAFPADKLARVSSWDMLVSFAAVPLGNFLAGGALTWLGEPQVLVALALVMAASGIVPAIQSYGDSKRASSVAHTANASN